MNAGIKLASAELILPLDADDKIAPNIFQLHYLYFQKILM